MSEQPQRNRPGQGDGLGGEGGEGSTPTPPAREIIRRIEEKGPVTFAEFMEVALYWPEDGYYTSAREKWGGGGDYVTSIDISPVFSVSIAKQIVQMWSLLGSPDSFDIVEAGAGRGWLSKGILSALKGQSPELYAAVKVHLVEVNRGLGRKATEKVTWHEDLSSVKPFSFGCILSNELIDSFPVHRVLCSGDGESGTRGVLKEVYTSHDGTRFVDSPGPPSTTALAGYLEEAGIELVEGQAAEINLRAGEWIKRAASLLESGFVITIDYGLPAKELYSPERPGTLLCHYRHTINDNPYINVGLQDITTHVDFTSLVRAGRSAGLELTGFTTQKNFLLGAGVLEEMREVADPADYESVRHNRAISELIMPGGMGDTFKVLVQHTGVEKPGLKGFSFKEMSAYL